MIYNSLNKTNIQRNAIGIITLKQKKMDLKTLNRIDKLRRLKSRGPKTPKWLKPYHMLFMAFVLVFLLGACIKILQYNDN
ncbi:hypothetical protein PMI13_00652 [Chryseobacterium populi]|uniref:Uncharacterized protein n=2 Tax=Chryseobacterium populi TaxID=1144316 RepID=J2TA91_9FLAO|nr:hypothetical protein PMI13_00652 [Chryseobacterium populi]